MQNWVLARKRLARNLPIQKVVSSEATPMFRVVKRMGSMLPKVPNKWSSKMLVYSARVRGYDHVMILRRFGCITELCTFRGSEKVFDDS